MTPPPDKVIWFYGIFQELYNEIDNVTFVEGLPKNFLDYIGSHSLIVIDDLMAEVGDDKRLTSLFTKGCHHLNVSVIFITQNLFHKGKEMRCVSLNVQYMFIFRNRRDPTQIMRLGRQLYPGRSKFFQEIYEDVLKTPYAFLLVDLRNETDEKMRLRTLILPNQLTRVYEPKYK